VLIEQHEVVEHRHQHGDRGARHLLVDRHRGWTGEIWHLKDAARFLRQRSLGAQPERQRRGSPIGRKYPGYTHVALRVASIPQTIAALAANRIAITQGPVQMGQAGNVSVFVRDPDRNVIELRGRDQGEIPGLTRYVP
jgi:catechol 2,3-dioxygenase-like lactoylglutathione lyase family enzyme